MAQKIFGSTARQLNDVNLVKDPKGVGDSLSVHLSQDGASAAVWTLLVYVHVQQGTFFLGTITTTPPSLGNQASRTVLIATCPAATGWKVIALCPTDGEEAEITIDSSKCCGSAVGVRKLDAGGDADQDVNIVSSIVLHAIIDSGTVNATLVGPSNVINPWSNNFSTVLANSFVVKSTAGTLRNLTMRVDGTLASGTYYVQLWNLAALPANGTVVGSANSLDAPVKVVHVLGTDDLVVYDFAELGIPFTAGAVLGLSSTEFTKTAVAGTFCSVIGAEYR